MNENKYSKEYYTNLSVDKDDEIDLQGIILRLWQNKKFIIYTTLTFIAIGVFIAFASPVKYTASSTFVPQTAASNRSSSLGGMASLMGINLGMQTSGEILSPTVYPQIINSTPFCYEIMNTLITVEKSGGKPITLYDYYTNPVYQGTNLLSVIKKYTLGLPGVLLTTIRSDDDVAESDIVLLDSISEKVITLTRDERRAIREIRDNIQLESNSKDGYITMGYTFAEPDASATIAHQLFVTLEKYIKDYKTQKQIDNLEFVEASYIEAQQDFLRKQAELARFQDANRGLTTALARTTEQHLRNEYNIAFTIYDELAKQKEQAKIAVKQSTPLLTTINPVVTPHQKSDPKRSMIVALFIFLGVAASIGITLIKPVITDISKMITQNENKK